MGREQQERFGQRMDLIEYTIFNIPSRAVLSFSPFSQRGMEEAGADSLSSWRETQPTIRITRRENDKVRRWEGRRGQGVQ